jgi:hypothetical protein
LFFFLPILVFPFLSKYNSFRRVYKIGVGSFGLYPLESCRYAIEIKSRSTSTEIKTTINKFRKIKQLKSLVGINKIHTVYFAYDSDIDKSDELERYKRLDEYFQIDPSINVLCVIGKGYWFYCQDKPSGSTITTYWLFQTPQVNNYEVASFVVGVINTVNITKPPFGYYIFNPDESLKKVEEQTIQLYQYKK